jgi:long-chain acyl-CoA synthetase
MKTICDFIINCKQRDAQAVTFFKNGQWQSLNWNQYYQVILNTACALKQLGLQKSTKVGIYSNTCFEWSVIDFAVIAQGGVTVPIYQSASAEELKYQVNHAEIEILFIETSALLKNFKKVQEHCPSVKKIILIKNQVEEPSVLPWTELQMIGEQNAVFFESDFLKISQSIQPGDWASIIYTSGTSGTPKGVIVRHSQIISEVEDTFPVLGVTPQDRSLSFLPFAHVLGRLESWGHMYIGFHITYAESIERIRPNLLKTKPTILVAVPRIFEKIYGAVISQMELQPLKSQLFKWGIAVGKQLAQCRLNRQTPSLTLAGEYLVAKTLVLDQVKNAFGGCLRFAVCGGAPLSPEVSEFFDACNVLILEGYGLTETTAAIAVNRPSDYSFGSVGKPVGDVKIKIAEDGEILVKSKKVTQGYFKDNAATDAAFTEGWFQTGDIGEFLPNGDLKITDRKKDLIKTAGGKYVAPQKLENLLKATPLVSNVLIHGDRQKYVVALVTLDEKQVKDFTREKGLGELELKQAYNQKKIFEEVRKNIAQINSKLASHESIKKFSILPHDFTIESGELTPSLKIKRKVLDQKYSKELEALYKNHS